jgi:hypothetical protein
MVIVVMLAVSTVRPIVIAIAIAIAIATNTIKSHLFMVREGVKATIYGVLW